MATLLKIEMLNATNQKSENLNMKQCDQKSWFF